MQIGMHLADSVLANKKESVNEYEIKNKNKHLHQTPVHIDEWILFVCFIRGSGSYGS